MKDIVKTISQEIESQFPAIYREEGSNMVAFVKAFYEYLEQENSSYNNTRTLLSNNDIDETLDGFVKYFNTKYLSEFPYTSTTDNRFLVKHVLDFYRTKGSERSLELLMRLLFNEEVDVYYPGRDVLKISDSEWFRPEYIEVTKSPRTRSFINQEITGSVSGAKAFVEGIVSKRVDGKIIDILYLSSVRGSFQYRETVTNDGVIEDAPEISGSLTTLDVVLGGRDNKVGDILNVVTEQGRQGKVRVSEIENATGRVDFDIVDGGYGYTNTQDNTKSDVYVSNTVLFVENSGEDFNIFEDVVQRIETIATLSATDLNDAEVGDILYGIDSDSNTTIATGVIVSVANTDSNGTVITESSANSIIKVQALDDTTFSAQKQITTSNSSPFLVGEYIEEGNAVTLDISSLNGSFEVGEIAEQLTENEFFDTDANSTVSIVTSISFGEIKSANSTTVVLDPSWGEFSTSLSLRQRSNTAITSSVDTVSISEQGARGLVTAVEGANVHVNDIFGVFDANNNIRGSKTRLIDTVVSVINEGADILWLNGDPNANGVLDTADKTYAEGIVVGQNTSAVGIYGNAEDFITDDGTLFYIESKRDTLISPPRFEFDEPTYELSPNYTIASGNTTITLNGTERANNAIFKATVSFPPLLDKGVLFEIGGAFIGAYLGISDSIANPGDKVLRFRAGNSSVDVASSGADMLVIDVEEDSLPINLTDNHEIVVSIDTDAITANMWIDGISVGSANASSLPGTKWSGENTGGYGLASSAVPVGESTNDWAGTIESDLYFYSNSINSDAVSGNIKEIKRIFSSVSTGSGANFEIGFLENSETVTLNTDMVGANNVSDIPFVDVLLDGRGSGVGFVDSVTINDGGSGYSNNEVITFSGGGLGDGDPLLSATGITTTDGAGTLTAITITDHGVGYFDEATINMPATYTTEANVSVNMDYGYGFIKNPNADNGNIIIDCLTADNFTIGSIASLTRINPGSGYNANPFVTVHNKYVASFSRRDFYVFLEDVVGTFKIGETLEQVIDETSTAKGVVADFDVVNNIIKVKRNSFNIAFSESYPISGEESGATGTVTFVIDDEESRALGDNATITGTVISASGIATELEVIDSGYGYTDGGAVELEREGFDYVVTAKSNILSQGIGEGYWRGTNSHLNSEKKIHDNYYYQEYSYDVQSGISLNRYANIVKKVLHVSGNELFGSVDKHSVVNSESKVANTSIELA